MAYTEVTRARRGDKGSKGDKRAAPPTQDKPRKNPILTGEQELTGKVVRIITEKGFAFLAADGEPEVEYFVHFSAFTGGADDFQSLRPGMEVHFRGMGTTKGPRAVWAEIL